MFNHVLNGITIDILLERFDPCYIPFLKSKYKLLKKNKLKKVVTHF